MRTTFRKFWLTAALLTAAMGCGAYAAAAAPNAPAAPLDAQQYQQLDEIMVRGTRVREAIANAEDEFFGLYNSLNKDDDYSASCVFLPLDGTTQIKSHICIPGFMADAMADQVYFSQQCQASPGFVAATPCYTPPTPQQVLSERSGVYANHLMKVVRSDPRLGQMAGNLDNLYHELVSIQQQYINVRTTGDPQRAPVSPAQGPRQK